MVFLPCSVLVDLSFLFPTLFNFLVLSSLLFSSLSFSFLPFNYILRYCNSVHIGSDTLWCFFLALFHFLCHVSSLLLDLDTLRPLYVFFYSFPFYLSPLYCAHLFMFKAYAVVRFLPRNSLGAVITALNFEGIVLILVLISRGFLPCSLPLCLSLFFPTLLNYLLLSSLSFPFFLSLL